MNLRVTSLYLTLATIVSIATATDCTSTYTLVEEISGNNGFDGDCNDFDVLRELIRFVDIQDLLSQGGIEDVTVFAPTDDAFYRLAMSIGYDGNYDESGFLDYIAGFLMGVGEDAGVEWVDLVGGVLFYHVVNESLEYDELKNGKELTTVLDGFTLEVKGNPDDKHVRLKTIAPEEMFPYPKINADAIDIVTCNGLVHVIK